MPVCFKCFKNCKSFGALQAHFQVSHAQEIINEYVCREGDCFTNCGEFSKFKRHFKRNHSETSGSKVIEGREFSNTMAPVDNDMHESIVEFSSACHEELTPEGFKNAMKTFLLRFVGKLYADPSLPRSHVQIMIDEMKDLLAKISSLLKPMFLSLLSEAGVHDKVKSIVQVLDELGGCLDDFSSEYRRLRLLTATGNLLYPKAYVVGYGMEDVKRNNIMVKEVVPVKSQYIKLRKLFKLFFSLPGVYQECVDYMENLEKEKSTLSNFVQGKLWREKKERHFSDKVVFPLFVYYDDLEVNNPLGSHKGVSKIGATYVTIPCLPTQYRSTLDNIFLALLCHSSDRALYSNASIFYVLVNEINYLQRNGITLEINNSAVQVYFALGLILGDNLGLNGVLGYVESFNAFFFCRFCKVHRDVTHSECVERPEAMRKVEEYDDDVNALVEESGVKETSIWNQVDHFHVYENYCSDPVLHEMAEGAGKRAIRHILYYFICSKKIFSLDRLNQRLKTFDYNSCGISNKPPLISEKEMLEKKLKMSGSETLNFIAIFAFLVGDFVSPEDAVWKFYLVLRQVLEIVCAKTVQIECVGYLKYLVSVYLDSYQKLFDENLKAKEHIMVHWPRIMAMSGPLSHISTMRMEGKNRVFKMRANATTSRINILFTTAFKEQLQFCYRLSSQSGLAPKFEIGPATYIKELIDNCRELLISSNQVVPAVLETCVDVPWTNVKGTIYKVAMCLALHYDERDLPVFGQIQNIFCTELQEVYFFCVQLHTVGFDEHFHAYKVTKTNNFQCWNQNDLHAFLPVLYIKNPDGSLFISMRDQ